MNSSKHEKKTSRVLTPPARYIIPILAVCVLIFLDQFTKYLITDSFALGETRPVIKDVFHLTYIQNSGMAWGLFQGKRFFFLLFTIPVVLLFSYMYYNIATLSGKFGLIRVLIVCVVAGAIGNMIDRIRLAYVVDFLDFRLINFPVFNVADIFVTCGLILFFVVALFFMNNEDFDKMFKPRRK